jgi:quinol-cytochrome oxidoreductase complex cytochrome b subunit
MWFILFLSYFVFYDPNYLGHPDNYIPANPLVTPPSIVPEWYFLPFYCILRSIPDKLLGVLAMLGSLLILIPLSIFGTINIRSNRYKPILQVLFWIFVCNFLFLLWLGAKPIAQPYTILGQIATVFYFAYFILLMILG